MLLPGRRLLLGSEDLEVLADDLARLRGANDVVNVAELSRLQMKKY